MSGFSTGNIDNLTRTNVWSSQLDEILLDELFAQKYMKMLTEFPDGDTFNIPNVGQMEVKDYVEDNAIQYTAMDTGNFTFTITDYVSSATYVTKKMLQDSYVMKQVESSFVPKQARAIMARVENDFLAKGPEGQTASNLNTINGGDHRFVGSASINSVQGMSIKDFARARHALKMANVPDQNLVAIVDPSVEYTLNTISNLVNVSNNPRWEGIIDSGIASGFSFIKNVFGFDVYTSQHLKDIASETIDSVASSATAKANLFFSATPDILPVMAAVRQAPEVDSEYNKDKQRWEYLTTMRYGMKLHRPENLVTVITDTDVIV